MMTLAVIGIGACNATPPPSTTPPLASPTTSPPATFSAPAAVPLHVRFAGSIGCATFPYGCTATLSVVEPSAFVPDDWRPSSADPWWEPDYSQGMSAKTFDAKPIGASPAAVPGAHRLIVSLLGSYDTPSYAPDGSRVTDLLGRCTIDIEVSAAGSLNVLITFSPDGASFRASCTVVAETA